MNPQNIVYIGLGLLAMGITIAGVDPLKPVQLEYVWAEIEVPKGANYFVDVQGTIESNDMVSDFKFEDGMWKFKIDVPEKTTETTLKVKAIVESQQFSESVMQENNHD